MRKFLLITFVILVAVVLVLSYYSEKKVSKDNLILYGNVDVRQVDLAFRVTGEVQQLFFEEGSVVKKGDLLASLDKQLYMDQVKKAEAELIAAKENFAVSEKFLARRKELIKQNSISLEELEKTQSARDVSLATQSQAEISLQIAKLNLEYTDLFAPNDGTILTRVREPGSVVIPSDPIYTLSLVDPVWIRAYVTEPQLGLIYPNMPAEIFTDTPGGKVYKGNIGFISPVAEFTPKTVETAQLRTDLVYRLRIIAQNPDQGLRQGMPVTVKLPLKK